MKRGNHKHLDEETWVDGGGDDDDGDGDDGDGGDGDDGDAVDEEGRWAHW